VLGAILYVLRTGIQWNALPRELGAGTTVYDRFRLWEADGFFGRL
jgi:putative transposase